MRHHQFKSRFAILLAGALLVPGMARATAYDAVTGFSKTQNPNGPWSYLAGGVLLSRHKTQQGAPDVHYWTNGKPMPKTAVVVRNYGPKPYEGATIIVYPDHLNLDPENVANVVVRFTAPLSGSYTLKGNFKGTDMNEASHHVAIAVRGSIVLTRTVSNFGEVIPFNGQAHLKKGDTIDFISRTDGNLSDLTTGLKVTVAGH